MNDPDVHALHAAMRQAWERGAFGDRARRRRVQELARLARQLPDGDLNTGPCADLAWQFLEDVADALRTDDPAIAARLYELAEGSIAREGSQATGAGEGLQAEQDRLRVAGKRESLAGPPGED